MSAESGFCPHCYHNFYRDKETGRVHPCRRRTCPGYAPKYLRDLGEVVRSALAEWEHSTTLVTATAPGADLLPWDRSLCKLSGPHRHSGPAGCCVNPWVAAEYNRTATKRFRKLLNHARQRTKRDGFKQLPDLLVVANEIKRGVFHVHAIFGYTPASRKALDVLLDHMDKLRAEYGFGSATGGFDRGQPGKFDGKGAGLYASKYLRPGHAKGSFVPALRALEMVIPRNEKGRPTEVVRPVWVSPKLTARSGVTMRFLRFARYAYRKWGLDLPRAELLLVYRLVGELGAELLGVPGLQPNPPPAVPF